MTSMILAIDPGTEISAYVVWDGTRVIDYDMLPNHGIIDGLASWHGIEAVVIEGVACYGMPVGKEVFSTCIWIGRFWQATVYAGMAAQLVYRQEIKLHHCGSARAKDSNVRQALIDRFGPPGTKKQMGLTYGLSGHLWSAFAIATYATDTMFKMRGLEATEGVQEGRKEETVPKVP